MISIFNDGATLVRDVIAAEEEQALLAAINNATWSHEIGRWVQHYGWRYDYRARTSGLQRAARYPTWASRLADTVRPWFGKDDPEQCIVNRYQPGEGIGMHTDAGGFGPVIVSVSLNADWAMRFRSGNGNRPYERGGLPDDETAVLPARSALVLTGNARHRWMHGICRRDSRTERGTRISVTFRSLTG